MIFLNPPLKSIEYSPYTIALNLNHSRFPYETSSRFPLNNFTNQAQTITSKKAPLEQEAVSLTQLEKQQDSSKRPWLDHIINGNTISDFRHLKNQSVVTPSSEIKDMTIPLSSSTMCSSRDEYTTIAAAANNGKSEQKETRLLTTTIRRNNGVVVEDQNKYILTTALPSCLSISSNTGFRIYTNAILSESEEDEHPLHNSVIFG